MKVREGREREKEKEGQKEREIRSDGVAVDPVNFSALIKHLPLPSY